MGNIFNYFWKLANIDLKYIFIENHQYLLIFKKYFENVTKIIFSIFWHFWTRETILYICWNFHNHIIFPSYIFSHLKILTKRKNASICWFSKYILKMIPKLFFSIFWHFWTHETILYIFLHIFLAVWKFENSNKAHGCCCQYNVRLT